MSPPRRRGRRVPPRSRGPRPDFPPDGASGGGASGGVASRGASGSPAPADRTPTRSANRAAKRVASGVRPVAVRGRVTGHRSRSYSPTVIGLAIAAIAVGAAVVALGNPFGAPAASPSPEPTLAGSPIVYGDGTCPTSQPEPLAAGDIRLVTIETDEGDVVVRVDPALSPIAAGNFVALVECAYYDGIVFHRTAALQSGTPFVIQGGDPEGTGGGGPGYTIQDEPVTASYHRGTVAMARTSLPNSQGSQFFIVLSDEAAGPLASANTYAIFGEVIGGMEVADAIFQASNGQENPANPIAMTSVTVADAPAASASPAASP